MTDNDTARTGIHRSGPEGRVRATPFRRGILGLAAFLLMSSTALAANTFTVAEQSVSDPKAVFATVESVNVVPARARIGGTVVELSVNDGDKVTAGQVVARIVDEKLALQIKSLDAEIAGVKAQVEQAQINMKRAEDLFAKGTVPRSTYDQAKTALDVATQSLDARTAARSVVEQQVTEGAVLAPTGGRVLEVPVTVGTVVLAGETVAQVAEEHYVLRLSVPERHARYMKVGDSVRLDAVGDEAPTGKVTLVYPKITDGRVSADAEVAGLGDYFVGERVRVWVSSSSRQTIVIPAGYVSTRFGADYVLVEDGGAAPVEVPVQRGEPLALPGMTDGLEILSGLKAGDVLVHP